MTKRNGKLDLGIPSDCEREKTWLEITKNYDGVVFMCVGMASNLISCFWFDIMRVNTEGMEN